MDLTFISELFPGSSLPGTLVNNGTTYAVSGGTLNFSGTSGTINTFVRSTKGALCEKSRIESTYVVNIANSTATGILIGWESYSTVGYKHTMRAGYISASGNANFGKIWISANTPSTNIYSTDQNTDVSNGDVIKITFRRVDLKVIVTVENITKAWTISHEVQTTPSATPFGTTNGANPAIYHIAGDISVQNFKYIIEMPAVLEKIFIGDSITYGQAATAQANRWVSQVGTPANNIGMGGGADTTTSVIGHLDEIVMILTFAIARGDHPIVFIMIGGNDRLFGVNLTTVTNNLKTIRNTIAPTGAGIVHLYTTPRNYASEIIGVITGTADFDLDGKIDINTPLQDGDQNTIDAAYDSGDALHPNNAGMSLIAATINAALPTTFNLWAGGPTVVVAKQSVSFEDAGLNVDNTEIVYKVDGAVVSWAPGRVINGISGFEGDKGYYVISKKSLFITALAPPFDI